MLAKKGKTKFGERVIATIVAEFRQLDKGEFPGKPVFEPAAHKDITKEQKNGIRSCKPNKRET